jgi:hypothetical protein
MIRLLLSSLALLSLSACTTDEDLRMRHGSPLHTYRCENARIFQARQIISGEVEVTAGGRTRDVTDADGAPSPHGPRLTSMGEATRLTGMPSGLYEGCVLDDRDGQ